MEKNMFHKKQDMSLLSNTQHILALLTFNVLHEKLLKQCRKEAKLGHIC